jgi:hypothetical protein
MFLAVLFIILGVFLLLNALGIIVSGNFWALVWGVAILAIGLRLLVKRGKCPVCGWHHWEGRIHDKIHQKMHEHCDCEHDHDHDEDGQDHH